MNVKKLISDLGGPVRVAGELRITSQAVSQWGVVPAKHCRKLSELSGGLYSVHDLRPDIFGPAPTTPAEAA